MNLKWLILKIQTIAFSNFILRLAIWFSLGAIILLRKLFYELQERKASFTKNGKSIDKVFLETTA